MKQINHDPSNTWEEHDKIYGSEEHPRRLTEAELERRSKCAFINRLRQLRGRMASVLKSPSGLSSDSKHYLKLALNSITLDLKNQGVIVED